MELSPGRSKKSGRQHWAAIWNNRYIYMILLPALVWYAVFCYGPMYGLLMAFKDYRASLGILRSPWVGLENFAYVFRDPAFFRALTNTFIISFSRILFSFAFPIILSILFNELRGRFMKKTLQTIYTFPHFLSWIVVAGIFVNLLAGQGALNNLLDLMGISRIDFLASKKLFRPLLYITAIWKEGGWSSIIYLAAIASISPELYEAAFIDGANRLQRILYITWPSIRSTVVVMLILAVGSVMNAGFDQIFNMQNGAVMSVSDILDTYIYRITFQGNTDFGFSTAVGLFKSVVNFVLLVTFNKLANLLGESGIF